MYNIWGIVGCQILSKLQSLWGFRLTPIFFVGGFPYKPQPRPFFAPGFFGAQLTDPNLLFFKNPGFATTLGYEQVGWSKTPRVYGDLRRTTVVRLSCDISRPIGSRRETIRRDETNADTKSRCREWSIYAWYVGLYRWIQRNPLVLPTRQ